MTPKQIKKLKSNIVILIISDEHYFKHLTTLIASIKINFTDALIWCHVVNPTSIHGSLLKRKDLQFSIEKKHFKDNASRKGYCANIRGQIMANILNIGYKYVLYIDADSIVRRNCFSLKQIIKKNDITIYKRDWEEKINMKFATGIIGIQNNVKTRLFVKKWIEEINKAGIFNWFSDQIGFVKAFDFMKDDIDLFPLPQTYCDWFFKTNTHIWTGKGERKSKNMLYVLEEKFYQKSFISPQNNWKKLELSLKQLFWRITYFILDTPKKIQYKLSYIFKKKNV